ncbi:electron transfer flavoprotein, beta subunit [Verminephrobacter eiseniae EF01-2]|uniref:Electron transfer flavoprotein, beta subunit n=2 Tax=Verminephrobacter eiseniae TaxID=364317 RepID=A1WQ54_VEREI|nr:electron transfer flavoprotein, beta subunit [Verminephrobacter eiseniae EF01-2]MCW5285277.1 electron transfer flavoprotein subunit beta [Verminephrobacter eiseniae]MCW5302985.1 electron transfer flavoprotein subunit beta [Verminephrobacter eiseniae]MCW8181576.1 electron transfer flavoprotein subunit beta [Verminephrobacter eiseniae]MCW8192221.1 electron transfer flavoprotein subunit beta [Verminephrobacter eiseniae]
MNHPMSHPMNHPMRHPVTVLVAPRSHPVSQRPTRCPADARAVTLALGLSLPVRLLTAGAMPEQVARDYLALGAGQIDILPCADDSLLLPALLPALRAADWVLTGTRSAVDHGSGVLPHALAAALQRPLVTEVLALQIEGASGIVTQALPRGARRRLRVQAPALLAVSAAAAPALRHSLADAMAGRIRHGAGAGDTAPAPLGPPCGQRVPANQRRQVLQATIVQSGHARMLGAIAPATTGGTIVRDGTAHTKAQAVLDYLRRHSLVSF